MPRVLDGYSLKTESMQEVSVLPTALRNLHSFRMISSTNKSQLRTQWLKSDIGDYPTYAIHISTR